MKRCAIAALEQFKLNDEYDVLSSMRFLCASGAKKKEFQKGQANRKLQAIFGEKQDGKPIPNEEVKRMINAATTFAAKKTLQKTYR